MKNIGIWLPPRKDLSQPITPSQPAHLDARLHNQLTTWFKTRGFQLSQDLDFRNARIVNDRVFFQGEDISSRLDHFFWMGMIDRSPDSHHLDVLRTLGLHVQVHNSWKFFSLGTDKFLAFSRLHAAGIPVPELHLVNPVNFRELEPLFAKNQYLLKPRRSHFGAGIILLDNFEHFRDTVGYFPKKSYYLERFYPNDMADWTGITVLGGKVVYGFRKSPELIAGWKVYDESHSGGKTVYIKPDEERERIALEIGRILGGDYYGLDIIKTAEGYKVVDINMSPGIYYDFFEELELNFPEIFAGKILNRD